MSDGKGEDKSSKTNGESKTKQRSAADWRGVELDVHGAGCSKVAQTFGACRQGWPIHETSAAGFEAQ